MLGTIVEGVPEGKILCYLKFLFYFIFSLQLSYDLEESVVKLQNYTYLK